MHWAKLVFKFSLHWKSIFLVVSKKKKKKKKKKKNIGFSRLITRKTSTTINVNVPLACCKPIIRQLKTTSRTISRLGERFNVNDVTNESTRTERQRVTTHGRDRQDVMSHLRDRLMPAVLTARNRPGTHNNSAAGPFSETGMCCGG